MFDKDLSQTAYVNQLSAAQLGGLIFDGAEDRDWTLVVLVENNLVKDSYTSRAQLATNLGVKSGS